MIKASPGRTPLTNEKAGNIIRALRQYSDVSDDAQASRHESIAYAIATEMPLPSSAVVGLGRYFEDNQDTAVEMINIINEKMLINARTVMAKVKYFYELRYNFAFDPINASLNLGRGVGFKGVQTAMMVSSIMNHRRG